MSCLSNHSHDGLLIDLPQPHVLHQKMQSAATSTETRDSVQAMPFQKSRNAQLLFHSRKLRKEFSSPCLCLGLLCSRILAVSRRLRWACCCCCCCCFSLGWQGFWRGLCFCSGSPFCRGLTAWRGSGVGLRWRIGWHSNIWLTAGCLGFTLLKPIGAFIGGGAGLAAVLGPTAVELLEPAWIPYRLRSACCGSESHC